MKRFTNEGRSARRNGEEEAPLGLSFEGGEAGARTLSRRQAIGLLGGSLAGASLLSLGLAAPAKSQRLPFGHGDDISLECLGGPQNARFFLDGRTAEGNVGLAPHTKKPFTGTRWEVIFADSRNQVIHLKCLGHIPGNRWLDGRTADGSVGLAPTTGGIFTGTVWQVFLVMGTQSIITLKCLGKGVEGNRWLVGRPGDRTVGLAPQPGIPETKWMVRILAK
jgi:hypothetical protein